MFSHSLTLLSRHLSRYCHALSRYCHHSRSVTSSVTLCHATVTLLSRYCHALSRHIFLFFLSFFHFDCVFFVFFSVRNLSRSVTLCHVTRPRHMTYFFILHGHELSCLRRFFYDLFFILHMVCHALSRDPIFFCFQFSLQNVVFFPISTQLLYDVSSFLS